MTRDQCFFNMELEPPYGDMVPAASMIHWSRCASRGMPWDHEWSWMISWSHGMYDHFDIYIFIDWSYSWWMLMTSWQFMTYWDILSTHHLSTYHYVVWNVSRCQICQASACIKTSSLWSSCSQAPRSKSIAATSWQIHTDSAFIADDRNIRNRI